MTLAGLGLGAEVWRPLSQRSIEFRRSTESPGNFVFALQIIMHACPSNRLMLMCTSSSLERTGLYPMAPFITGLLFETMRFDGSWNSVPVNILIGFFFLNCKQRQSYSYLKAA
ncbi:hypothetical protein CEXT_620961 [Caerostris extrusa]|uniref:Uncharacterized protein n=1 Tax=Caerostris extrusa TaxID=172846 RepID=A0AAV4SP10_CAEEX|nr:hypothetical protein CEXT_620961 [Caerostris extrusa]